MTDESSSSRTPEAGAAPSAPSVGGDDIDFAALVAEHNVARTGASDGLRPASVAATPGASVDARPVRSVRDRLARTLRDGSSQWWRVGFPVVVGVALLVVAPLLVWLGLRVILDSSDGQLVKRVTDPNAPGYEAVVTKTPTALVAMTAPDNTLAGVAILALTSESSGGVLTMPPTLAYRSAWGEIPIAAVWGDGTDPAALDNLGDAVGSVVNLSFADRLVVRAADWTSIATPTGVLSVTIPDGVRDATDAIVIAKGPVQLRPEQVGVFLTSKGPREDENVRTVRQEIFWKAWLAAMKRSGAAFPGSTSSGLGRYVAALTHGDVSVSALPVTPLPPAPPIPQRYAMVPEAGRATVAAIVPFPDGAPGERPRVRSLDGTGKLGNGLTAAIQLNAGGGQVDVVGNAKSFGEQTTQIIWYDGSSEEWARKMREAIGGIGEIVQSKASNSASDITVILGEDYLAKYGPTSDVSMTPTTTR